MQDSKLAELDSEFYELAQNAKAWPFVEAKKLVNRIKRTGQKKVIFQTGYGPSGLPHIGTFGEVARTTMVRTAFHLLTKGEIESKLICFSDDLDGLRKVPDNVPNKEMMRAYLNMPLSRIPDPFSNEYPSFAAANNARLRGFLDSFGFDYEFASATEYYSSGRFDEALMKMLKNYDKIMDIILPTLGEERRATYSPFLPICKKSGKVLQVPMIARDEIKGTITYVDPQTKEEVETSVKGGAVKCQWKADWALRWFALGVDYEMAGKDLIDSVRLSSRIVKAMGGTPPEGFNYELFLDEKGQKISKSKGNGLTMQEWLKYATPESLALFMFQKPKTAKKLYFDIIPKTVDEYYQFVDAYHRQDRAAQLENPAFHIHSGNPGKHDVPISFTLLLNLVSAANAEDKKVLWGFISKYVTGATPKTHPELDRLVGFAISYFHDFIKPSKIYRSPNEEERQALLALMKGLEEFGDSHDGKKIQELIYKIGNEFEFEPLRDWFKALYQILLGQNQGPRFGSFIALYGVSETIKLIRKALNNELTKSN